MLIQALQEAVEAYLDPQRKASFGRAPMAHCASSSGAQGLRNRPIFASICL